MYYMSKFIKLTNVILNTSDIHKIVIQPKKYYIHIVGKVMYGSSWSIFGSGAGHITSLTSETEICETNDSADYKIISDWINQI